MMLAATTTKDERLAEGYRDCSRLTRAHGTTYWWGARILPAAQRRDVHAVYALCRLADDIVDADGATTGTDDVVARTARALDAFEERFFTALDDPADADPVMAAIATTVRTRGIDPECFGRFFGAMRMDLTVTSYETFDDLCGYMEGSAAVIGEMMLPVLEPTSMEAREPARVLGLAFQVTNFLRDVAEDLDRGRVYLPAEELRAHGADPHRRIADAAWREFLHAQIVRNRAMYRFADTGLAWLPPASARCVATARELYSRILDRIEARGHDVFSGRARVSTPVKAFVALRHLGERSPA